MLNDLKYLANRNVHGICNQSIEEVGGRQSSSEQVVSEEGEPNGNVSKPIPSINPPVDVAVTDSSAARSKKIRERPSMKSIQIRGSSYHCVNW